jgi:homocitrate synthase NifV
MSRKIYIIDVTNRDGVQTARISLSKLQKTMLNMYLSRLGVHQVEIGFPFSLQEKNYINANESLKEKGALRDLILEGWCRAVKVDVDQATKHTNLKDLNLSISTSTIMTDGKFKGKIVRRPSEDPTKKSVTGMMLEAVQAAKDKGIERIGVNAEDASRTDMAYLIDFSQAAKEAGAVRIRYCDTLGYDTPETIYKRVKKLAEAVKIDIELHCHNDLGSAVANSVMGAFAAIDAGVDAYINTTVNGYGERAGNADLISCLLMLNYGSGVKDHDFILENINLKMFRKIAKYAAHAFDQPLPINQPVVGANAFAHESGIHTDGALKDRHNYELFDYDIFGEPNEYAMIPGKFRTDSPIAYFGDVKIYEEDMYERNERVILAGEYGGLSGLKHVYSLLNIEFKDNECANRCLDLVRQANAHNQRPLTNDELRFIAAYPDETAQILKVDFV